MLKKANLLVSMLPTFSAVECNSKKVFVMKDIEKIYPMIIQFTEGIRVALNLPKLKYQSAK